MYNEINERTQKISIFIHLYLIVAYTILKIRKYDVDKKVQIFTKYCKKEIDYKTPRDMKNVV